MSNSTEESIKSIKKSIPFSLIIASIISITIVIIIIISIIIFIIWRRIRENSIRNPQIFVEEQNKKSDNIKNIKNKQNSNFKPIPNSSVISNDIRQNMSLVEIKERNLKEQIHNIIHGSNVNKSMDGIDKKKKRKNGKRSTRSTTKSDEGNSSIKISEEIEKKENKVNTIEHV